MGVYIKDMEMPKNCRACRLKMNCEDCEGFECVCPPLHTQIGHLDDLLTDKRRDDCPLVPVPPHGRLIDADALIAAHKDVCSRSMKFNLDLAPTIIEADKADMDSFIRIFEEDDEEDGMDSFIRILKD